MAIVIVVVVVVVALPASETLKLVRDVNHLLSSLLEYHLTMLFFALGVLLPFQRHRPTTPPVISTLFINPLTPTVAIWVQL